MLKIEKVVSEQYLPLTKQQNLINFVLNAESSHMMMSQSYIQFEMSVNSPTSGRLSFGQDYLPYYPVCMIRRCRLVSSTKGTLIEVNNLNILMHNLLWHNKTTSENMSDALWGWGATQGSDYVHSVFTDYSGNNCVVKIPFKHLFPGDIGLDDELNVEDYGFLTIMLELEPSKNLFQQVVSSRWGFTTDKYTEGQYYIGDLICADLAEAGAALTITFGNVEGVGVGDVVQVSYTAGGSESTHSYEVLDVDYDTHVITFTSNVPASTAITVSFNNLYIHCDPIASAVSPVATNTLVVPASTRVVNNILQQFNGSIQDITSGKLPLLVDITYRQNDILDTVLTLTTSITTVVVNGDKTITLTLAAPIPAAPANKGWSGIEIQPFDTNVNDAVWQVNNAYCFPYRLMGGKKEKYEKSLFSQYTYEPLPFVSDGSSFSREIQVAQNAYNCFLLTPPSTNTSQLYSMAEGIENYRFFLNDVALSNIPLDVDTNTDLDMKTRVYNNSCYPLRNLSGLKNDPLYTNESSPPQVFTSKLKPKRQHNGQPNYVESNERKNLRVEINGTDMPTAKTIYFFKEEYKLI